MLKQSESLHLQVRWMQKLRIYSFIFLFAFSLHHELSAQKSFWSKQDDTETAPPSWLTPLDLLIDWPYTQETKREILEQKVVEKTIKENPLQVQKLSQILPWVGTIWSPLPENPEVGYNEFVARRTATDQERITHQDSLKAVAACLWYRPTEFYLTYQDLSYYLQDWWSWTIYTIPLSFFEQIKKRQEQYSINPKIWIQLFIDTKKYPKWKPLTSSTPNKEPDPLWLPNPEDMFRKKPGVQTTEYSKISLQVYRYDRKSAAQLLTDLWCRFRSTNLQNKEIWKQYTSWYTSVEGVTQDFIDWMTTLVHTLQSRWIEHPQLWINWATEWYDHWMGNSIIAWHVRQGTILSAKNAKNHWSWFTVDIRLVWLEATMLQKIFPWTKGKVQIWSIIYMYYFHGKGKNQHLHLTMLSEKHYEALYGAFTR